MRGVPAARCRGGHALHARAHLPGDRVVRDARVNALREAPVPMAFYSIAQSSGRATRMACAIPNEDTQAAKRAAASFPGNISPAG